MTLELTREDERLVRRFMSAGGYHSPEELLVSLLNRMSEEDIKRDRREREREESWTHFECELDLDQLAEEQGVGAIPPSGNLVFSDWPKEDSVDAFIARATGQDIEPEQVSSP